MKDFLKHKKCSNIIYLVLHFQNFQLHALIILWKLLHEGYISLLFGVRSFRIWLEKTESPNHYTKKRKWILLCKVFFLIRWWGWGYGRHLYFSIAILWKPYSVSFCIVLFLNSKMRREYDGAFIGVIVVKVVRSDRIRNVF